MVTTKQDNEHKPKAKLPIRSIRCNALKNHRFSSLCDFSLSGSTRFARLCSSFRRSACQYADIRPSPQRRARWLSAFQTLSPVFLALDTSGSKPDTTTSARWREKAGVCIGVSGWPGGIIAEVDDEEEKTEEENEGAEVAVAEATGDGTRMSTSRGANDNSWIGCCGPFHTSVKSAGVAGNDCAAGNCSPCRGITGSCNGCASWVIGGGGRGRSVVREGEEASVDVGMAAGHKTDAPDDDDCDEEGTNEEEC